MTAPWTEAHRREALRRMFELAALGAGRGVGFDAKAVAEAAWVSRGSEATFRQNISYLDVNGDDADREVARVRALAEGRLVRETGWRVIDGDDAGNYRSAKDAATARLIADEWKRDAPEQPGRAVRVTRIRRPR